MRRLSLKARLTFTFTVAVAAVIAAIGVFVDRRAAHSLRAAVDQGLRARAVDVANLASQADNGLSSGADPFSTAKESFGQLIDAHDRVYDATPGFRRRPVLPFAALDRARREPLFVDLDNLLGGPARVFAAPIHAQDERLVLIVGTSLTDERRAISGLRSGLLLAAPIALLLSSLGGYLLAAAALRPVERMRARAAEMSTEQRDARLPVPDSGDEIARLGRTLNDMLARLERSRQREQQFLADASHELRTPLSLLKTEIEVALQEPGSRAELEAALRSAAEETDRLVQLAEDLLLLAQFDRGILPLRAVATDAGELAERVAARFALRASAVGRRIEVESPSGLSLRVDPLRLEQALGNLIDNALRHGAGTITIRVAQVGEAVELHVRDQGDGIPPHFRARAFERFSRDDTSRHSGGTGLGLAIVGVIAHSHHGEAVIGEGADVYMRLP